MDPVTQRLAAVDEVNLVLDHASQVNVFLIAGLLAPGGFLDADGTPDMAELHAALRDRVTALPQLCRRVAAAGRRHRWVPTAPDLSMIDAECRARSSTRTVDS